MTYQLRRTCPHCKGIGTIDRDTAEGKSDKATFGFFIAFLGFLGAMAFGAGFWMACFVIVIAWIVGVVLAHIADR